MLETLKHKELDFGEMLSTAWQVYKNKLGNLIKLFLLLQVPFSLISSGYSLAFSNPQTGSFESTASLAGYLLIVVLQVIASLIFSIALLRNYADGVEGKENKMMDLLNESFKKFLPFFLTTLIFMLFMIPLTIAFVIPAVIFGTYWMFYGYSVIVEDKKYWDALQYSKKLVNRRWIMTFGYNLLTGIMIAGVTVVFFLLATFCIILTGLILALVPAAAVQTIGTIIATPIFVVIFLLISLFAYFGLSFSTVMFYNWKYNIRNELETASVEEEVSATKE